MDESEKITLEKCRRFYDDGNAANHEIRLSREEEQSADFQLMLEQMARLYKSDIPLMYGVEKILNARVKVWLIYFTRPNRLIINLSVLA